MNSGNSGSLKYPVMCPPELLFDLSLSANARICYCCLLARDGKNWTHTRAKIMKDTGLKKDKYPEVMGELHNAGWIVWVQSRRHPITQEWIASKITVNRKRQKPASGKPTSGKPGPGKPGPLSNTNTKSRAKPQDWNVNQEEVIEKSDNQEQSPTVNDESNPPPLPDDFDPNKFCQGLDIAEKDDPDS